MNSSSLIIADESPEKFQNLVEALVQGFPSLSVKVVKSQAQAVATVQMSPREIVVLKVKITLREGIRLARFVAGELGSAVLLVELRIQDGEGFLPSGIVSFNETEQTHAIRKTIIRALSSGQDQVPASAGSFFE